MPPKRKIAKTYSDKLLLGDMKAYEAMADYLRINTMLRNWKAHGKHYVRELILCVYYLQRVHGYTYSLEIFKVMPHINKGVYRYMFDQGMLVIAKPEKLHRSNVIPWRLSDAVAEELKEIINRSVATANQRKQRKEKAKRVRTAPKETNFLLNQFGKLD